MKITKKVIAVGLATLMVGGALVGCSGGKTTKDNANNESSSTDNTVDNAKYTYNTSIGTSTVHTLNPHEWEYSTELDIMECFEPGHIVAHNAFTGGYGLDMKRAFVGGGVNVDPKEFHTFGMLWDETGYTFYIDGVEDGKITDYVSHRPEFILISTEVKGYRLADHRPTEDAYRSVGDTFLVDYVRVYESV